MFRHILRPLVLLALTIVCAEKTDTPWLVVSRDPLLSISGMAVFNELPDEISFLVVHDNKTSKDPADPKASLLPRVGILTVTRSKSLSYVPLSWPRPEKKEDIPDDLEAIALVPEMVSGKGKSREFVALASGGKLFHFLVDDKRKEVVLKSRPFEVPKDSRKGEFEGLALVMVRESLFALWATRANGGDAFIFWRQLNVGGQPWDSTATSSSKPIRAPLGSFKDPVNKSKVRAISDIRVGGNGEVVVASTYDESDAGPFSSVVHRIGRFEDGKFQEETPSEPLSHRHIKIEAIEFVPNRSNKLALATDDENCGSIFHMEWRPLLEPLKTAKARP